MLFRSNDTATTEIYTSIDTLSLHDALPLSNLDARCFAQPERYDPDRFAPPREEDVAHAFGYVPFGGGRHRCLGANFALMQQKAIFSVLLRQFAWGLVDEPAGYVDNYSAMVVRPRQPFRVRYQRRTN